MTFAEASHTGAASLVVEKLEERDEERGAESQQSVGLEPGHGAEEDKRIQAVARVWLPKWSSH